MMFYNGEQYEARPEDKELVDWRAKRIGECALTGEEFPKPLRFTDNETYDIEIRPETGGAMVNECCDEMDCVWVEDVRDGTRWVIFRDEINNDHFDNIISAMRYHGSLLHTFEPSPDVERLYRNRKVADLSRSDSFPQEWDNPPEAGDAAA